MTTKVTQVIEPATTATVTSPSVSVSADLPDPIIIDLGKKSKKKIKQLRKGRGKALQELQTTLAELRANGILDATSQPVCLVVREKLESRLKLF